MPSDPPDAAAPAEAPDAPTPAGPDAGFDLRRALDRALAALPNDAALPPLIVAGGAESPAPASPPRRVRLDPARKRARLYVERQQRAKRRRRR